MINPKHKFQNHDIVGYDNGVDKGEAIVVGIALIGQAVIGETYILRPLNNVIPNEEYPYDCFACFECHIQAIPRKATEKELGVLA